MTSPTDPIVETFENHSIDIRTFNHRQHVYIAYCYLKTREFQEAVDRYVEHLKAILEANGQSARFNLITTILYFLRLRDAMERHPTDTFEQLLKGL